jgi:hypothetical protein
VYALASTLGVGEIVIAALAGYAAYQILREHVAPEIVARELLGELEQIR